MKESSKITVAFLAFAGEDSPEEVVGVAVKGATNVGARCADDGTRTVGVLAARPGARASRLGKEGSPLCKKKSATMTGSANPNKTAQPIKSHDQAGLIIR